jgi:hypothetical protein
MKYITLKAQTLTHFISLSSISPTRFCVLLHHHQGLRISCCEKDMLLFMIELCLSKVHALLVCFH